MNKDEFMSTLKKSLGSISQTEKNDILYDYEEHFRIGKENGKTENVIVEELGDPIAIGNSYITSSFKEGVLREPKTKSIFASILAAICLGLFNLIFLLGPYLGLLGALLGLFCGAIGLTLGGFAYLICIIIFPLFNSIPIIGNRAISLFVAAGSTALGLLFIIGMCYVAKGFYILTIKYLKINKRIITH